MRSPTGRRDLVRTCTHRLPCVRALTLLTLLTLLGAACLVPVTTAAARAAHGAPQAAVASTLPATSSHPWRAPGRQNGSPPLDRIVAVVNREVVTKSQLDRAVRNAREAPADPTENCTPPDTGEPSFEARVLQCLIDELLQFQHVRRFPQFAVLPEDIAAAYRSLEEQYPSPEAFEQALEEQGRTPAEVRYDLEREALIANYVELRYRAIVDISEREVGAYYEDVLRPEMERGGEPMPPLQAVDDDIERILVEMEVNRRVDEWIADLRRRADITAYTW